MSNFVPTSTSTYYTSTSTPRENPSRKYRADDGIHVYLEAREYDDLYRQGKLAYKKFKALFGKDKKYGHGDVIVVKFAFDRNPAQHYIMALVKTPVGWFTTGQQTLRGARTFDDIFAYFYGTEGLEVLQVLSTQLGK